MTVSRIRYIQKLLIALCACVLFFYAPTQVYAAIDDNSSSSVCGQSPDTPSEVNPGITIGQYKKWCLDSYKDLSKFAPNPWDDGACKCTPKPIITLNTAIPGFTSTNAKGQIFFAGGLPAYIVGVYKFFIGASVIISLVMIMIAGFQWTLAGGIAGKIETAKDRIKSAVAGLLLGLFSYSILFFVNPALIDFGVLNLTAIPGILTDSNKVKWPVDSKVPSAINQFFGGAHCDRVGIYCTFGGNHEGLDIGSKSTKPNIIAIASGEVVAIEPNKDGYFSLPTSKINTGYGCRVIIRHTEGDLKGKYSLYGHLSSIESTLKIGTTVKAGDIIGKMGGDKTDLCSGTSNGQHLHLNVCKSISNGAGGLMTCSVSPFDNFEDPLKYINDIPSNSKGCNKNIITDETVCNARVNSSTVNGRVGDKCTAEYAKCCPGGAYNKSVPECASGNACKATSTPDNQC